MKYYIKAWFGDWKEVTKEKADSFIQGYFKNFVQAPLTEELKQEIIKKHYKEVDDSTD